MKVYVAMYFVDNGYGESAYDLEDVAVFNNENDAKEWAKGKENEYDYVQIVARDVQ
jgi:hypothetical protein